MDINRIGTAKISADKIYSKKSRKKYEIQYSEIYGNNGGKGGTK